MTSGPIEYGDEPGHEVPPSEYGGADGLVQPAPHGLTASELRMSLFREAMN